MRSLQLQDSILKSDDTTGVLPAITVLVVIASACVITLIARWENPGDDLGTYFSTQEESVPEYSRFTVTTGSTGATLGNGHLF